MVGWGGVGCVEMMMSKIWPKDGDSGDEGAYRRVPLPSFLNKYFGQKRIAKPLFLAEDGSIKGKTLSKQAENWLNRPQNDKIFSKTDCQNSILAKMDRLNN